jgi:hypothetical protein
VTDRLALATRVRRARRSGTCPACRAPIIIGQSIARLIRPNNWVHVNCVPVVARALERARLPYTGTASTEENS